MADPPEAMPQATEAAKDDVERDIDADMGDAREDDTTTHAQETSTSTLDNEPMQTDTQPTSSLPHQNRKDTTLREFLSKMDDYAPIVSASVSDHLRDVNFRRDIQAE